MSTVLVKELIEAGVHFGHRASRWNPKMRPYIYGRRNLLNSLRRPNMFVNELNIYIEYLGKEINKITAIEAIGKDKSGKFALSVPWVNVCVIDLVET